MEKNSDTTILLTGNIVLKGLEKLPSGIEEHNRGFKVGAKHYETLTDIVSEMDYPKLKEIGKELENDNAR